MHRPRVDPYVITCAIMLAVWLAAWLLAFPNLYGWLTDDAMTLQRINLYMLGGRRLLDIEWFHAYMWFILYLPWKLHWSIPSHVIARSWNETGFFRALLLWTILLHVVILAFLADFVRKLAQHRVVAAGAFLLILTSPTLLLYADLLDSRYLGLIFALPGMFMMLRYEPGAAKQATLRSMLLGAFVPGLLIAIAADVHYECVYLTAMFAAAFWLLCLIRTGGREAAAWLKVVLFALGIAAWVVPIQELTLHYHTFIDSYIGTLLLQRFNHTSPYPLWFDDLTWIRIFFDEMGVPMMLAAFAGACMLAAGRWRPPYVSRNNAHLMVLTVALASAYFLIAGTHPFYRMVYGLQFFYAIFAMVALERLVSRLHTSPKMRAAIGALAFLVVALLPSGIRGPEVFAAQQGLGKAVNYAYGNVHGGNVYFLATYDWDPNPRAILSRAGFDRLKDDDVIVTDYPIFFHVKYPDLLALMYDAKPVAAYPTEWCTQEVWAELRTYFGLRKWYAEPMNCQAQVYRVSDLRRAAAGVALPVAAITADSMQSRDNNPRRALELRNPGFPYNDNKLLAPQNRSHLWVSDTSPHAHWLQIDFAKAAEIGEVTIVPPDYRVPPDVYWTGRRRISSLEVQVSASDRGPLRSVWSASGLSDILVFSANFPRQPVKRIRFVIVQDDSSPNHAAALSYVRFPGYVVRLPPKGR